MIRVASQLKKIATEDKLYRRNKCVSDLQRINANLLAKKDHLRDEMDEITSKLADAEVARETALRRKLRSRPLKSLKGSSKLTSLP